MAEELSNEYIERIIKGNGYLTIQQAALYLKLKTKTLADYRHTGRKPEFIKRGQHIRYPSYAIIDFIIERNKAKPMPIYDNLLLATPKHSIEMMKQNHLALYFQHGKTDEAKY